MNRLDRRRAVVLVLAALAGCGDFTDREDGTVAGGPSCAWPIDEAVPGGSIELGTDRSGFAPLPAELPFIKGNQSGVFLVLQARMVGLEPGDPDRLTDPRNPRTRFWATFADGSVHGRECPSRVGYVPSDRDGALEREAPETLEFIPAAVAAPAFDTVVKLKVEVIDAEGRYASDERDVFCSAPAGLGLDAGPADAGPEADGGPADASPGTDGAP